MDPYLPVRGREIDGKHSSAIMEEGEDGRNIGGRKPGEATGGVRERESMS